MASLKSFDMSYLNENQFDELNQICNEIARILSGLMRYLSVSDMKGRKFKDDKIKI